MSRPEGWTNLNLNRAVSLIPLDINMGEISLSRLREFTVNIGV